MTTYNINTRVLIEQDCTYQTVQEGYTNGHSDNSSLWVGYSYIGDGTFSRRYIAMRFTAAKIPNNAIIISAVLRMRSNRDYTNVGANIKGYVHGIAGGGTITTDAPATKTETTARTIFSNGGVTAGYSVYDIDVANLIQEMVSASYWTKNSQIGFKFVPPPNNEFSGMDTHIEFKGWFSSYEEDDFPRLQVTYQYTPTLEPLAILSNSISNARPIGFVVSPVLNTTNGSTKTVTTNTSGGRIDFNASTNQLVVAGSLSGEEGKTYTIEITETLEGAAESPKTSQFVISVNAAIAGIPPSFISFGQQNGTLTFDISENNIGDLMIAYSYSILLSASFPVLSIPGWTKVGPTVNSLYGGAYGGTYDVFYRISNGTEPSTYTAISDGQVASVGMFVVRDHGRRILASNLSSGTNITWESLPTAADDSLIVLIGGDLTGTNVDTWDTVIPSGTIAPVKAPYTGYSIAYYPHGGGPTPTKTAPKMSDPTIFAIAYTLVIEPDGPPTLAPLTVNPSTALNGSLSDVVVGAINGSSVGSTLSVVSPTMFKAIGTNLLTSSTLTSAGNFPITIRETLAGATNSPRDTTIDITVVDAPLISFIGTYTGTNTATISDDLKAGDLILVYAYRDGSTTAPTLPAGFTAGSTSGASTQSYRMGRKIASEGANTVGTWTNASSVIVTVYRPRPGCTLSVGATANANTTATSISYPALTLQNTDGTSWVIGFGGHRSVNTTIENPPTGMINRASIVDAVDEAALHDTNGGVSSWTLKTVPLGGTASGWCGVTTEIKVTQPSVPTERSYVRSSTWLT